MAEESFLKKIVEFWKGIEDKMVIIFTFTVMSTLFIVGGIGIRAKDNIAFLILGLGGFILLTLVFIIYVEIIHYKEEKYFEELFQERNIERLVEIAKNGPDKEKAIKTVGRLGPKAKEAIPELISIMKNDEDIEIRLTALKALTSINGERAQSAIEEAMNAPQNSERQFDFAFAHMKLAGMKSPGKKVIKEMIDEEKLDEEEEEKFNTLCVELVLEERVDNVVRSAIRKAESAKKVVDTNSGHFSQLKILPPEVVEEIESLQNTIKSQEKEINELTKTIGLLNTEIVRLNNKIDNLLTDPIHKLNLERNTILDEMTKEDNPEEKEKLANAYKSLTDSMPKEEHWAKKYYPIITPVSTLIGAIAGSLITSLLG